MSLAASLTTSCCSLSTWGFCPAISKVTVFLQSYYMSIWAAWPSSCWITRWFLFSQERKSWGERKKRYKTVRNTTQASPPFFLPLHPSFILPLLAHVHSSHVFVCKTWTLLLWYVGSANLCLSPWVPWEEEHQNATTSSPLQFIPCPNSSATKCRFALNVLFFFSSFFFF